MLLHVKKLSDTAMKASLLHKLAPFDSETTLATDSGSGLPSVMVTQQINPPLWRFQFHFISDPVLPGNFGAHGIITLLKQVARDRLNVHNSMFISLDKKNCYAFRIDRVWPDG